MNLTHIKEKLEKAGVKFAPGLTPAELNRIEVRFGFRFPSDLSAFLGHALPVLAGWPDWRHPERIQPWIFSPLEGILFDVEHNAFWMKDWGPRPVDLQAAFTIATMHIGNAPKLIPVYSHRYMPDRPHEAGNPVLSVHQTDIIYYGLDLEDYLENEFGFPKNDFKAKRGFANQPAVRKIEFWSILVENDDATN